MLSIYELVELLYKEDEVTILELLDIDSQELVDAFKGKLKKRKHYVEKYFDEELSEEEEVFGTGVHIETWKDQLPFDED
jgi:hypothetical protein